jgi:hypothetical protein
MWELKLNVGDYLDEIRSSYILQENICIESTVMHSTFYKSLGYYFQLFN